MPLVLKECLDRSTFSRIVDCEWAGYYNPYHPFMQVLFPVFGGSPESRAAAIEESKERQWQWHSGDPTSHWLYVEDDQTGEVIGGAQWHVHAKNPFEGPQPKLEAYWWPEGECKRFMTEMLEQVYGPRRVKMTRPHTLCNLMFVHPAHRRRGAGRLLMGWGVEKAQEKGFEVFVEGTDLGRPLYESFGLAVVYVDHLDAYEPNMSDEWRKLEREILPMHWYFMWKPVEGVYQKGKTVVPWETDKKFVSDEFIDLVDVESDALLSNRALSIAKVLNAFARTTGTDRSIPSLPWSHSLAPEADINNLEEESL